MKTFLARYRNFKELRKYFPSYRFCWFPLDEKGNGIYSCIEFFDEELDKIDPNKVEIIQF